MTGGRHGFVPGRAFAPAGYRTVSWLRGYDPLVVAIAVSAVLLLAVRQAFTVPFTGLGLSPAELILFVLLLFWIATRLTGARSPAGLGVLSGLVVVRLCLLLISYGRAAGGVLDAALRDASQRLVLFEFAAAGTVIVLAVLLRTRRDVELVLRALVIGGAISAVFAVVQYGTGVDIAASFRLPGLHYSGGPNAAALLRLGVVRSQGSAGAPLELGAVMTVLVPLGLGLTYIAHRRRQRWWIWGVLTALLAAGGIVSVSRVVFVGTGLALLVMFLRWPVRRSVTLVLALAVVSGVALATGARVVDTVTQVLSSGSQDNSLASRSNGRHYVWTHFAQHFWFGQGPGTYDLARQPILDNQYLGQLMETGALGLIAFAGVLLCALAYALRATAGRVGSDAGDLATAIAAALAAVIVATSVLDTTGFIQVFALTWLLVGLAAAVWRVNVADARPRRRLEQRPPGFRRRAGLRGVAGVR